MLKSDSPARELVTASDSGKSGSQWTGFWMALSGLALSIINLILNPETRLTLGLGCGFCGVCWGVTIGLHIAKHAAAVQIRANSEADANSHLGSSGGAREDSL